MNSYREDAKITKKQTVTFSSYNKTCFNLYV